MKKRLTLIISTAFAVMLFFSVASFAENDFVEINEENFPDDNFRMYVEENIDSDSDGVLSSSEILDCNSIEVIERGIESLAGIEYFENLTELICWGNYITDLDLSNNTLLENVDCQENKLSQLSVVAEESDEPNLIELYCAQNELDDLYLSACTSLETLDCQDNQITQLDISNCISLRNLDCQFNQIEWFYADENPNLEELYCGNNELRELDLSNFKSLKTLYCNTNNIFTLDTSKCPDLEVLDASYNYLTNLDLSNNNILNADESSFVNNRLNIKIGSDNKYNLEWLRGFEPSKATNWKGAEVEDKTLIVNKNVTDVTYDYDCGNSQVGPLKFKLALQEHILPEECDHIECEEWKYDAEGHWTECVKCGMPLKGDGHYGGRATCFSKARCKVCGASYGELANHKTKTTVKKATLSSDGCLTKVCPECGSATYKIYRPKSFALSTIKYTYSGGVKTPSVIIKDSKGNALKKGTDYNVSYSSGRKYVGKYSVKITFKGNFSGTKTLYFTINPKGTSISSLKRVKKGFKVYWKKQSSQTSGYQIRWATKSSMSGSRYKTISGNKHTSKSITKLKSKKYYYVQVRTYKTIKGIKYYSGWSSAKKVKTK